MEALRRAEEEEEPREFMAMELASEIHKNGFQQVGAKEIRDLVGRHCVSWLQFNLTDECSAYSVATLTVLAYLTHFRAPRVEAPPAWKLFDALTCPLEVCDALRAVAARWRSTDAPTWEYVRYLESRAGELMAAEWDTEERHDMATILARLWGAEYVADLVRSAPEVSREVDAAAWVAAQRAQILAANQTRRIMQQLLSMEMWFGEEERYARSHGGVKAADYSTVLGVTRTHVQSSLTAAAARTVALPAFRAVALVDHAMRSKLDLDWFDNCVILDLELMDRAKLDAVAYHQMPWLLLLAGKWYAFCGDEVRACSSVGAAIWQWFEFLSDTRIYQRGEDDFDLSIFYDDEGFPFTM